MAEGYFRSPNWGPGGEYPPAYTAWTSKGVSQRLKTEDACVPIAKSLPPLGSPQRARQSPVSKVTTAGDCGEAE
ncbi:hypothetical protein NDU88_005712 [Pleurodeles waltl]|uniref:Uncharacterized protein n=1 Tax=Pleurodeles waltl TaxID=8319 RepID=A0AAV7LNF3_PLEWA|nr:hypothetical protein NDU88_005712 [Pleurodeles waltl]